MSDSKSFDRIINLMAKADNLNREINELKPFAVRELRKMGYSADRIVKMLGMGKVTVLAIIHGRKKKLKKRFG